VAAAARGVPTAWARATDQGSSPPYGLWRLLLEAPAVRAGVALSSEVLGNVDWPDLGSDFGSPGEHRGRRPHRHRPHGTGRPLPRPCPHDPEPSLHQADLQYGPAFAQRFLKSYGHDPANDDKLAFYQLVDEFF